MFRFYIPEVKSVEQVSGIVSVTSCSEIALYPGWFPHVKSLQLPSRESLSPVSLVFTLSIYFTKTEGKACSSISSVSDYTQLEIAIMQVGCRDELTFSWIITPVCLPYLSSLSLSLHLNFMSCFLSPNIFSLCTLLCCTGGDRGGFFESGSLQPTWR